MTSINTLVYQELKKLHQGRRQIPIPGGDGVLIKIKAARICGTDIRAWGGNQPFFGYPHAFGYEICGKVIGLGRNILNLKSGQQVTMTPCVACRQCPACLDGQTNYYEEISVIGVRRDDRLNGYLYVPVDNLLVVDNIDPEAVALIKPFTISTHAVRHATIRAGEWVPVVGADLIGFGVAVITKADDAQVVATDTDPARCDHVAQRLGLTAFDPPNPLFIEQLSAVFGDFLAQKMIDAAGSQQMMNNIVSLVRHGDNIVFVGLSRGELQFSDPEFHKEETAIMDSHDATEGDFAEVRRLMAEGKVTVRMMLTHRRDFRLLAGIYENDAVNNRQLIKDAIHL